MDRNYPIFLGGWEISHLESVKISSRTGSFSLTKLRKLKRSSRFYRFKYNNRREKSRYSRLFTSLAIRNYERSQRIAEKRDMSISQEMDTDEDLLRSTSEILQFDLDSNLTQQQKDLCEKRMLTMASKLGYQRSVFGRWHHSPQQQVVYPSSLQQPKSSSDGDISEFLVHKTQSCPYCSHHLDVYVSSDQQYDLPMMDLQCSNCDKFFEVKSKRNFHSHYKFNPISVMMVSLFNKEYENFGGVFTVEFDDSYVFDPLCPYDNLPTIIPHKREESMTIFYNNIHKLLQSSPRDKLYV